MFDVILKKGKGIEVWLIERIEVGRSFGDSGGCGEEGFGVERV